ncbi:class I SAM-dependent methyltransferase [Aeromicrobium chenweiae]|uniref:SAM-dependent methyltransferase n=1 Tax=Aeromicrobium chenweiae TaxID=2079793 RepID=A0A2S0WPS3_9ACTN|nr:class I SAM-dependent methyltransferase [Aeromicrobium chenweiae]AWB93335.1 SAM-dependent methyltransferase [Aeromicrobium chenweiae]TGN34325.1 class I SAM-dependent methyltransferase [Aeromicrobium chenweiae]
MDPETFAQLMAPAGQELLGEIAARAGVESDLALGTRLRRTYEPGLVAAAVTQNHLRGRATTKFGPDAARMYFTHDALEQSTRLPVANHRARRLAEVGATSVVDLGCGIGGDLIAMARAGLAVRGVDQDPVRAAIAQANLRALGLSGEVVCADALQIDIAPDEVAFVDPARRNGRGRTFSTADLQPPWEWVRELLTGRAVAKVMPGLAHDAVPAGVEAEWVSDGGDLVEACLWGTPFATVGRRATVLPSGAQLVASGEPAEVGDVGAYLYEPDDAVIRAGLVGELAATVGGRLPDPHIAYVSSDRAESTPLARGFRILEELPFREKPLKAALQARGVGTLTIKKRGVDIVPEEVVRRMKLKGSTSALVVMTRVQGQGRAYLVERI